MHLFQLPGKGAGGGRGRKSRGRASLGGVSSQVTEPGDGPFGGGIGGGAVRAGDTCFRCGQPGREQISVLYVAFMHCCVMFWAALGLVAMEDCAVFTVLCIPSPNPTRTLDARVPNEWRQRRRHAVTRAERF